MTTLLKESMHESAQQELITGWGSRLRETRLARNISLEEIYKQLHLEKKLLESIEAEDLDRLPSSPFVKGYLRNYARVLEIDHEPIVAAYSELDLAESSGIRRVVSVKETNSKDKTPRFTTWLVVAVVILSLLLWWSEMMVPSKRRIDAPVIDDKSNTAINSATISEQIAEENIVDQGAEIPVSRVIKLQFNKDSWVEITDADKRRLFLRIGKEGESRTVEGVPPFNIILGNSKGVVMEYDGELFDHRVYESKNIARFILDN